MFDNKNEENLEVSTFLQSIWNIVEQTMKDLLIKHSSYKANLELFAEYIKMCENDDEIKVIIKSFQTKGLNRMARQASAASGDG